MQNIRANPSLVNKYYRDEQSEANAVKRVNKRPNSVHRRACVANKQRLLLPGTAQHRAEEGISTDQTDKSIHQIC